MVVNPEQIDRCYVCAAACPGRDWAAHYAEEHSPRLAVPASDSALIKGKIQDLFDRMPVSDVMELDVGDLLRTAAQYLDNAQKQVRGRDIAFCVAELDGTMALLANARQILTRVALHDGRA
jgi:hypothetical protein